ncbi:MAG: hypothetical protein WCP68_15400 [Enhydrobacter sp.]
MPRLKRTELALVTCSIVLSFCGIEFATRLYDHRLSSWTNFVRDAYVEMARPKTQEHVYDPELGWRNRPGLSEGGQHIDERGLRLAGPLPSPPRGGPILLAGDSNTFGNEVSDEETWAAYLQTRTGQPVLNAGVSAYGFDQSVLRAEIEAKATRPADIVVGLIAHDLPRMEASRLWGANRPYFDIEGGKAVLRNVPVPPPPLPDRPMPWPQRILGYSYFIDFMIRRVNRGAPWYGETIIANPRGTGDRIACLLMERLRTLQDATGARVLVVAQYDTETWHSQKEADERRLALGPIVACAREHGLHALDSFDAIAGYKGLGGPASLYLEHHMNGAGNRLFAELIARTLAEAPPAR